jgi:hypothetical protein
MSQHTFLKVRVGELTADVHVRFSDRVPAGASSADRIAWCGVYAHPNGPVPGYWFFPSSMQSSAILASLGCYSHVTGGAA